MTSNNRSNGKSTHIVRNGPSFRKVAERVQQWNRAIPESDYISLGTIRYGVRRSPGPLSLGLSATNINAQSQPDVGGIAVERNSNSSGTGLLPNDRSSYAEQTSEYSQNFSTKSYQSGTQDTCCCLRTASTHLPWSTTTQYNHFGNNSNNNNNNNNNQTKLPIPISGSNGGSAAAITATTTPTSAKNRIQLSKAAAAKASSSSSSISSSFPSLSLAVSSAPTPTHTSRSQSFLLSEASTSSSTSVLPIRKDDHDHIVDGQIDGRTQTVESCRLETLEEAATILGMQAVAMPKIAPTTSATAMVSTTTPSVVSHTEAASEDRTTYGKRSGCACCQNASRNSSDATDESTSNISATSASSTTRNTSSGEIGCCCELNSVSVGQFCGLPTPLPQPTSRPLSDTPSSSTNICCYTIANSSKSISRHVNRGSHQTALQKRLPRAALEQDLTQKVSQVPPTPPPRPRPKNPGSNASDRGRNSDGRAGSTRLVPQKDPINFRRKLKQFESYGKNGDRKPDDGSNAIGCGGDNVIGAGFELLSCFSGGSINAESSLRKTSCCSPNSEISYSGSSSKSEPQLITSKSNQPARNSHTTVSHTRHNSLNDRPPICVSRNNSHPTLKKVFSPTLQKTFSDLYELSPGNEISSSYRKLTSPLTRRSFLPSRRDSSNKINGGPTHNGRSHVLPQHDAGKAAPQATEDRFSVSHTVNGSATRVGASAASATGNNHNDSDRVRATLVEIVDDGEDDDEDVTESADNDDEFIDYDVDHDDDVDSEICFIDSSQSDIDLIGSLNGYHSCFNNNNNHHNKNLNLNVQQTRLSGPSSLGASASQLYTRPVKLSSFNTSSLFAKNDQVPKSSLVDLPRNDRNILNNTSAHTNNKQNQHNFNYNSYIVLNSSARSRGDFDPITRSFKDSERSGGVYENSNIPSSFSVANVNDSNQSLSVSYSSLNSASDLNRKNIESECNGSLIDAVDHQRIIPRIDRSQSFDSYKKSASLQLSSSASGVGIVCSSSGQLTSSTISLSPLTPPLSFTYASGATSPLSSSSSLLIYTSQQPPAGASGVNSKGHPVIGRRVLSFDSFGNYSKNQLHANTAISPEAGSIMEKRRNTLDRLQRLRFGRRSSPSPTPSQQDKSSTSSSSTSSGRRGIEKSEVLKELTERLKGNRLSPTPPPVPPPRKPRQTHSLEKPSQSTESSPLISTVFGSDDIIPMDAEDEKSAEYGSNITSTAGEQCPELDLPVKSDIPVPPPPPPPPPPPMPPALHNTLTCTKSAPPKISLIDTLRPNASVSNLESLILRTNCRDDVRSAPSSVVNEEDLFKELPRAESRILVGAYAQRSIPFRSISFSQIDFSASGKYVRSSLSALRDKWKRDKENRAADEVNTSPYQQEDSGDKRDENLSSSPIAEETSPEIRPKSESMFNHKDSENERMSLEEIVKPPEVILEEEVMATGTDKLEDENEALNNASETSSESALELPEIREEQLPESIAANYVDASETTLATLTEEEMPFESPPENLMQTATTCLIPVPVYECSAREWETHAIEQQWVNVEQNEVGMTPVATEHPPDYLGKIKNDTDQSSPENEESKFRGKYAETILPDVVNIEQSSVPKISVSSDTQSQLDSSPEERSSEEKIVEFPEVRKRYSNDDFKDTPTPRANSIDEKRRIDKSRRRKGMYIQWPTINKHGVLESPEWDEESTNQESGEGDVDSKRNGGIHLDFSKIKLGVSQEVDNCAPLLLNCKSPEDILSPGSSFEPNTPDSEAGKPVWPKAGSTTSSRRASLTLQSSEEKDESLMTGTPSSQKSVHSRGFMFLRSDSISDNENELKNRDRGSPSSAPNDHDYKRYSKRPLRGPYGQMLEAEMKKPSKTHYDEIFEDLKSSESLNTLSPPNRNRIIGNLSFDEAANRQQKNSRARKSSAHLPVPSHTRAASTPSQMENTTTTVSIDPANSKHKRYQSNLDTSNFDRTASTGRLKDSSKKLSVDARDRSPKRASSEALEIKHHNAKRSASTASDKQPKRSLDEMRLSSRTPSERSMVESTKSSTSLLPTPELLAELLKGSSERLVAEQRQQMFAITNKWFSLTSPLYTKRLKKMSNATPTPPPPPPPTILSAPCPNTTNNSNNSNNNNISNNNVKLSSSNNNRQKLRLSLFDLQHSNLNSSCDNPSSQDEMSANDGSTIDSVAVATHRSSQLQKMPSSTYSDSEDDAERKAQIELNNRWNINEEGGDTRTHIVQEIFQNEQSYVEDLQTVIVKYLNVLKTPEYAGMIDSKTVDEIFFMVPEILSIHERFLNELRRRLEVWEPQQMVGDAFVEAFSKVEVLETYTLFVNNCNRAKDAIRTTCQSRPSFSRFLQNTSREHKGKLTLDNLLIKPVQKFPNYELLFRRLIKHTDIDHPDQKPLQDALKLAHDILLHINAKKKEGQENGQREAALRELEGVIEGVNDLVTPERQFIVLDVVSMPNGQGARKERGFFLFSDLLVITSIKRRSGTIRKPNTTVCPGSVASTLDSNKYKFLMKIPLENIEIVKSKDESVRKIMNEIDQLVEDCSKIQQISKIISSLRYPHQHLEESLKDLHREMDGQLKELKSQDNQLNMLELTFQLPNGIQNISVAFGKPESRSQWEENFTDAKQKLVSSLERHPIPEFLSSIPIRKTRAGLQFTCAAPTLSSQKDVWVCNSDGYVGQVCVLSLFPEPTVTSCNGVCNARILCVASVPACNELNDQNSVTSSNYNSETPRSSRNSNSSTSTEKKQSKCKSEAGSDIKLDSSSSSSDSEGDNHERVPSPTPVVSSHHQHQDSSDDTDGLQSTMWLGTEDGCIHVYNCTDNIRIKKNKIKIQHVSAVYSILYLDNRVFVSLANGDICVYLRDSSGWNTTSPHCLPVGTVTSPVNRLLNVQGKLWCSIQGIIKVLDTKTLQVETQIQISSESKPITNMAVSANNVWISIQNSAHIKCFHSNSYEQIFEVNLAPSVNKMLCNCDDIIRQHKAACLRVTSLLACRDLIWIGTSAGVLLTIPSQGYGKPGSVNTTPVVTGIPHGHTGHVRFLTFVETDTATSSSSSDENGSIGYGTTERKNKRNSSNVKSKPETANVLIISGGDGYEDFRSSGANTMSEVAGREDSTNHLLLWQM